MLQSTLPHGERPRLARQARTVPGASIHAPARGATVSRRMRARMASASIHAPARGATVYGFLRVIDPGCFNPRSRAGSDQPARQSPSGGKSFNPRSRTGSDLRWQPHADKKHPASIHAPARGATRAKYAPVCQSGASIHAPARGATLLTMFRSFADVLQSTLPHGERPRYLRAASALMCFNPRSRTGSDAPCA